MNEILLKKEKWILKLFENCLDKNQIYEKILELGKKNPPLEGKHKCEDNRVIGCQSQMHLHTYINQNQEICFHASSDSLIASGLAFILTQAYSQENIEVILKHPPKFLEKLKVQQSISINRINGLSSLHLKMKQDALKQVYCKTVT